MGTIKRKNYVEKPKNFSTFRDIAKTQELGTIPEKVDTVISFNQNVPLNSIKKIIYASGVTGGPTPIYVTSNTKQFLISYIQIQAVNSGAVTGTAQLYITDDTYGPAGFTFMMNNIPATSNNSIREVFNNCINISPNGSLSYSCSANVTATITVYGYEINA